MREKGGLRQFWADLKWAVATSVTSVMLLITIVLNGTIAGLAARSHTRVYPAWALLALPLALFQVGFLGTQRAWFFSQARSERLTNDDIWSLSWTFFWRFVRLGLLWALLTGVVEAAAHPFLGHNSVIWSTVIAGLVTDLVMTFVPPALVLATDSVMEALRIGLRTAVHSWPHSWPYLLTPGLTFVSVGDVWGTQNRGRLAAVVIAVVGSALGLWFKGAIVRLYLRLHPGAGLVVGAVRDQRRSARIRAKDASWSASPREIIPEPMPGEPSVGDIARRMQRRSQGEEQ